MKKNTAPKGIKIKMSREEIAYQIFIAVVVGLLVLCCLIPFLYVVGMSFTSEGEMIQRNFFVIIPQKPILAAYEYLLKNKDFFSGMGITIVRTAMGVCTALILTVPVGYILAIGDLPFKNGIMVFFITTMVLSGGIIPTYILYRDLHLLNSFWVYIVPSLANTYGILVCKLFVEGIPMDIMESAQLDGANERQKMIHIAIPLLKPTLCALGLFAAVGPLECLDGCNDLQFQKLRRMAGSVRNPKSASEEQQRGYHEKHQYLCKDDLREYEDGQRYPCGITDSVRIPLPSEIFRKGHVYGLCKGMSFPRKRELNGGLV